MCCSTATDVDVNEVTVRSEEPRRGLRLQYLAELRPIPTRHVLVTGELKAPVSGIYTVNGMPFTV